MLWERVWLRHQGVSETWHQSPDLYHWQQTITWRSSSAPTKIWAGTKDKLGTKFLHINLALDSKIPTQLDAKVLVLRRGCSERVCALGMCLEIQSHEANRCSRLDQLTHRGGRAELGLQHQALQSSPCRLLGNNELNHHLAVLQLPGKAGRPSGFQAHWSQSCQSHKKPQDGSRRVSSTLPYSAACQKFSDPRAFPFHGKCWNLGFVPIWNETRFCYIEILHEMTFHGTALLIDADCM